MLSLNDYFISPPLIVNNGLKKAFVLVDGEFVGEYDLSWMTSTKRYIGYSILSGINRDFGTRYEITGVKLWKVY